MVFCDICDKFYCTLRDCDNKAHAECPEHERFRLGVNKASHTFQTPLSNATGSEVSLKPLVIPGGLEPYKESKTEKLERAGRQEYLEAEKKREEEEAADVLLEHERNKQSIQDAMNQDVGEKLVEAEKRKQVAEEEYKMYVNQLELHDRESKDTQEKHVESARWQVAALTADSEKNALIAMHNTKLTEMEKEYEQKRAKITDVVTKELKEKHLGEMKSLQERIERLNDDHLAKEHALLEFRTELEKEYAEKDEGFMSLKNRKDYLEKGYNTQTSELEMLKRAATDRASRLETRRLLEEEQQDNEKNRIRNEMREKVRLAEDRMEKAEYRLKRLSKRKTAREAAMLRSDEVAEKRRQEENRLETERLEMTLKEETKRLNKLQEERTERFKSMESRESKQQQRLLDREEERKRRAELREERQQQGKLDREQRKSLQEAMIAAMQGSMDANLARTRDDEKRMQERQLEEAQKQREELALQRTLKKEELASTLKREDMEAEIARTLRQEDINKLKVGTRARNQQNAKRSSKVPSRAFR